MFCMFRTALLGLFYAEPACGASAALRALVPAPKVRDAQIQHPCDATRTRKRTEGRRGQDRAGQGRGQGRAERAGQRRAVRQVCLSAQRYTYEKSNLPIAILKLAGHFDQGQADRATCECPVAAPVLWIIALHLKKSRSLGRSTSVPSTSSPEHT
jgi:hypothetical protein